MQLLVEGVVAIGIGLFIGLEREHSDTTQHKAQSDASALGTDTHESLLGVRTFALLALFGWITAALGDSYTWLPPAVLLVMGALIVFAAVKRSDRKRGLTTEVAALTTFIMSARFRYRWLWPLRFCSSPSLGFAGSFRACGAWI